MSRPSVVGILSFPPSLSSASAVHAGGSHLTVDALEILFQGRDLGAQPIEEVGVVGPHDAGRILEHDARVYAKLGDRQVITSIGPNEPVLEWKITGPGQRATLSLT